MFVRVQLLQLNIIAVILLPTNRWLCVFWYVVFIMCTCNSLKGLSMLISNSSFSGFDSTMSWFTIQHQRCVYTTAQLHQAHSSMLQYLFESDNIQSYQQIWSSPTGFYSSSICLILAMLNLGQDSNI